MQTQDRLGLDASSRPRDPRGAVPALTVKYAVSGAVVAIALLTCLMSERAEARILAKSVGAGRTPKARISVRRLSHPRNLRYQITAKPEKQVEIETGTKCEDGPLVSVNWNSLTALPGIERSLKLPLSKPVHCSVSVYARYRHSQPGRIVITLFGRTVREAGGHG